MTTEQPPIDENKTAGGVLTRLREETLKVVRQRVEAGGGKDYWRDPLVACASADDPAIDDLRRVVASDHAAPRDLLPDARSVIVYFLPFRPELGLGNTDCGVFSSRDWAESYVTTNSLIGEINAHLRGCFEAAGYRAAVTPATHNFDEEKLISRWSHKHLAVVAGLGTFGLHHLIITRAGCCGRLGSLVTSMPIPPTSRIEDEYCLVKAGHRCSACVPKCTYGALTSTGLDRRACYDQCLRTDRHYSDLPTVDVCGKCGCEVPCSYGVPPIP